MENYIATLGKESIVVIISFGSSVITHDYIHTINHGESSRLLNEKATKRKEIMIILKMNIIIFRLHQKQQQYGSCKKNN